MRLIINLLFFSATLLFLFACSGEKPASVSDRETNSSVPGSRVTKEGFPVKSGEELSLEITPATVIRKSVLYLIPRGFQLSEAKIDWFLNGERVSTPVPGQFMTGDTRKKDSIQATATIYGKQLLSNIVQVENSPPEITRIKILPEVFKPDDMLTVEVTAHDPDDDPVTIAYQWTKNGQPAGTGKRIDVPVKRGDKIDIAITPSDGESSGRVAVLHREIVNLPPGIVHDPKHIFDGKTFTYQIRATDPDNDTLSFHLRSGPSGMTVDPSTGVVRWPVPPDFKGTFKYAFTVKDGHGGEATQEFTAEIIQKSKL